MLNFNNYCLSVARFTRLFTAYSLIVVQKNNKHTQSLKNVGRAFLFTACWRVFCLYQKVGKVNWRALFLNRHFYLVHSGFVPAPNLFFFIFLRFRSLNFAGAGAGARKKISKKDRFHSNGPYCKIPTEN